MRRRDLDRAGAEFRLDKIVGNYWNFAIRNGQNQCLANQALISIVAWVHRDGGVAQHRLRPRRGNSNRAASVIERITKIVKLAFLRLAQNFEIGKHRLIVWTPVDDAFAAIDHALVIETHENFAHRPRKILVHRESFARPIDRGAFAAHLFGNLAAGVFLPFPNALDKLFATQIVTRLAFFLQLARDHQLR